MAGNPGAPASAYFELLKLWITKRFQIVDDVCGRAYPKTALTSASDVAASIERCRTVAGLVAAFSRRELASTVRPQRWRISSRSVAERRAARH